MTNTPMSAERLQECRESLKELVVQPYINVRFEVDMSALLSEIDRLRVCDAKVAEAILVVHALGATPTGEQHRIACDAMREFAAEVSHE